MATAAAASICDSRRQAGDSRLLSRLLPWQLIQQRRPLSARRRTAAALLLLALLHLCLLCWYAAAANGGDTSFHLRRRLQRQLSPSPSPSPSPGNESVRHLADLWRHLRSVVLPALFADKDFAVHASPPRLRQLRAASADCPQASAKVAGRSDCRRRRSSWQHSGRSAAAAAGVADLKAWSLCRGGCQPGPPDAGAVGRVSRGGFVAELGDTEATAAAEMDRLLGANWTDEDTSALVLEFGLYFPGARLLAVGQLLAELPPAGGVAERARVRVMPHGRPRLPELLAVAAALLHALPLLLACRRRCVAEAGGCAAAACAIACLLLAAAAAAAAAAVACCLRTRSLPLLLLAAEADEILRLLLGLMAAANCLLMAHSCCRLSRRLSVIADAFGNCGGQLAVLAATLTLLCCAASLYLLAALCHRPSRRFSDFASSMQSLLLLMLNKEKPHRFGDAADLPAVLAVLLFTLPLHCVLVKYIAAVVIRSLQDSRATVGGRLMGEHSTAHCAWWHAVQLLRRLLRRLSDDPRLAEPQDYVHRPDDKVETDLRAISNSLQQLYDALCRLADEQPDAAAAMAPESQQAVNNTSSSSSSSNSSRVVLNSDDA